MQKIEKLTLRGKNGRDYDMTVSNHAKGKPNSDTGKRIHYLTVPIFEEDLDNFIEE